MVMSLNAVHFSSHVRLKFFGQVIVYGCAAISTEMNGEIVVFHVL